MMCFLRICLVWQIILKLGVGYFCNIHLFSTHPGVGVHLEFIGVHHWDTFGVIWSCTKPLLDMF